MTTAMPRSVSRQSAAARLLELFRLAVAGAVLMIVHGRAFV
jgi:hypothetical protein